MDDVGVTLRRISRLAEQTPPSRERFIDLLRALSIVAVVLGHWLATVVGYDRRGDLTGRSALPELPWAHPLTWVVQVMPVFFLVGGYANAVSLAAERRRGGGAAEWVLNRTGRLVPPTNALVLVMAGGALVARVFGADPSRVRLVVWFASIPLWFLVAYFMVVVLTPPMYALHRRFGLAVPLALTGLVALGDLARLFGQAVWGQGSFLFGWLAIHQMGFAWRDGRLPARPGVALPLLAGGIVMLVVLTVAGPYPISMINIPGERLHNMSPPSLALLSVAATQLGMALLLRDRAERWLRHTGPWTAVVAVNAVILTIFLWHMAAMILVTGLLHLAGVLPVAVPGSAGWLAWRIPWLAMCALVLAFLVAVFGPIEINGARRRTTRQASAVPGGPALTRVRPVLRLTLTLAGCAGIAFALLANSLTPATSPAAWGIPAVPLIVYLVSASVLRCLRASPRQRDAPRQRR
ncbi:acyltransferase family protein [Microbispora sp. ATCC PTA-5024]|uniref:acyltransferase family protein n=1 Tax=Microbispora sp. ATCC PTA-5024 TaxID=316330 RepID=UPI0003DDBD4F|nr:acyltransferase [Microbispora sp. ATCC PTA-5024]ETK36722.1 acyltransferase [Microbispora sp. ATCC PTA-5024]